MKALFKNKKQAIEVLKEVLSIYGGCGQTEKNEMWAISDCNGFETVEMHQLVENDQYGYPIKTDQYYLTVSSNVVCGKACELEDFIGGFTNFYGKN
jgi:hypothetical protein